MNSTLIAPTHSRADLRALLREMEQTQLVRHLDADAAGGADEYLFKHALTQAAAYDSLLQKARRQIHLDVARAYETFYAERLDENAALLAYHFDQADDRVKTLEYLPRAAQWAHGAAAHRQEIELLGRAIEIANALGKTETAAELHAQRGKAFASLAMWAQARPELDAALAGLPPAQRELRAEILIELAFTCNWLQDVPGLRRCATEALALAHELGRQDFAVAAECASAFADSSDGLTRLALKKFENAFKHAANVHSKQSAMAHEIAGTILYFVGQYDAAFKHSIPAAQTARELYDHATYLRAVGNIGLIFMAQGRYREGLETFAQAREYGKQNEIETWSARIVAMESGCHLEIFDFAGAEALAHQAREMARASNFIGPIVSSGIDLMFNYTRRQEPAKAQAMLYEIAEQVERGKGSHGWLWQLRFAQARAELELVRENWTEAVAAADQAIQRARATGRVKYLASALATRGVALVHSGRKQKGMADLDGAVKHARKLGDPAIFLRIASQQLAIAKDDALAGEARALMHRTAQALPTPQLRDQFEAYLSEHL